MFHRSSDSGQESTSFFERAAFIYLVTGVLILITIAFSYVRYLDFFSENWDLGINLQQLWTNTHGYLLYDAGDYESYGVLSHLEVHSSFLAYPLSFFYLLFPSPVTIFSVQSFAIFSSVPVLYFLSLEITNDRKISTLTSLIYGLNATLIAAALYDYHWLSFMPLYSFLFLYLLLKRHYLLSTLVIIIGSLTEEAFSFISISILLFVFMSDIRLSVSSILTQMKKEWKLVLLGGISILTYLTITVIQHEIIPAYLNNQSAISILLSKTAQPIIPPAGALYEVPQTIGYWSLSLSLLCLIPLFYKKTIYIVLIWLIETIIFVPHYATVGSQYSFVTLSLLAPTLPYGLSSIKKGLYNSVGLNKRLILPLIPIGFIIAISVNEFSIVFLTINAIILSLISALSVDILIYFTLLKMKRINIIKFMRSYRGVVYASFLALILSMNFMVSPLNPQNNHYTLLLGGGYKFQYSINPESKYMKYIQEDVGHCSTIVASNNLFPFVADDINAYSTANASYSQSTIFPFNSTNLPKFILLSSTQEPYAFNWILQDLKNPKYRIACEIFYSDYPGNITLWEFNYLGNTVYYYA